MSVRSVRPVVLSGALLAVLAYLPALIAKPGRMPADSKLYLYLDPGRFLADAAGTFDPRQFAGWVPHQHVSYLWPAGPWYWLFDLLHIADWVAHRLWIGTVFVAAGLGARACARHLGFGQLAALVAAITYQLSPYVLPYVSRTSVMLLPWAGLGWIVVFTIRASRRRGWADPAAVALVVATVGAVNATALAMIVPGPVLWLAHEVWRRSLGWRAAVVVAARIGALSLGVSLWWIVMLLVQGRHGVDVLPYSESLADVSLTSTGPEVWRSLGYWLFYVRDPYAAATTESLRYLVSTPAIALSFLAAIVGLAGLVWTRWPHRRFAALLAVTGLVLGVGVHPVDDRSPLMRLLTGDGDTGVALALRSSTRAIPLLALGLALGAGALISATTARIRVPVALIVAALALANVPGHWSGALVDPALERDQDPPPAWQAAAADLDATGVDGRVLQLPGAEFGAYRWGYTVDQPLPGLTERPLVTRDLLPLGSPAAMDLLFALDDRLQDGVLDPAAIAPISRLLGVDTVWLTNDHAVERFATARPEIVRDVVIGAPGVGDVDAFGEPQANRPDVPFTDGRALADHRVGIPRPPVELAHLDQPGRVVRAAADTLVVSGSGEGLVDAAAAGLIDGGAAVRYSADLGDDRPEVLGSAVGLVVTDSNRVRAHHWRSSQDTRGFTEHRDGALNVIGDVVGDARLPVFDGEDPDASTWAAQVGPVTAAATAYGEPFAYLPERRPVMAIDGDPDTAWLVGEHADPIGERIVLTSAAPVTEVTLRQPAARDVRRITAVDITTDHRPDGDSAQVQETLDERSWSTEGQVIELDAPATQIAIAITSVGGGTQGTAGALAGVGFAEIDLGLGPTVEVIAPPTDAVAQAAPDVPLAIVSTRWRVDPMDRWRDDPEPSLRRRFPLSHARTFDVDTTVRVDARASDRELADLFGWPVTASTRLAGSIRSAGVAAFDGDDETAWITGFESALGATLRIDEVDRPVDRIAVRQRAGEFSRVTRLEVRSPGQARTVDVTPRAGGDVEVVIDPPLPPGPIEIAITGIEASTTVDRRFGDTVELPVAISAIDLPGAPAVNPLESTDLELDCVPVVRIDGADIAATVRINGGDWLDGAPVETVPCDGQVELAAGEHTIEPSGASGSLRLDRLVLDDGVASVSGPGVGGPNVEVLDRGRFDRTVRVDGCASGCWLVVGEGFNTAWSAQLDGTDLGPPTQLDGGFNGWWIAPGAGSAVVEIRWTAQWPLTIALIASLGAALAAIALIVLARRHRAASPDAVDEPRPRWEWAGAPVRRRRGTRIALALAWSVAAGMLIAPVWALVGLAAGAAAAAPRRRLSELTALATMVVVAVGVVYVERRDAPFPNGGWPTAFERFHEFGMLAAVALLVGALFADDADASRYPRAT